MKVNLKIFVPVGLRVDQLEEVLNKYELCLDRVPEYFDILSEINEQKFPGKKLIEKYASWTGRTDEICHNLSVEGPKEMIALEQVLLLSSMMEFSLGNVRL